MMIKRKRIIGDCTLYLADCIEVMHTLPDKSVDIIWTDPPYGLGNQQDDLQAARVRDQVKGGRRTKAQPIQNDSGEDFSSLMQSMINLSGKLLKPVGAFLCCCMGGGGQSLVFCQVAQWIENSMDFFHAVVWDKSARGNGMGWRYRRNYEFIYVAHRFKGRLAWNEDQEAQPNILRHSPVQDRQHPNQKPVDLIQDMLRWHGQEGCLVLDPCMGSGSTGVAAVNMGMRFIGCEIDEATFDLACQRIENAYRDRRLLALIETKQPTMFGADDATITKRPGKRRKNLSAKCQPA